MVAIIKISVLVLAGFSILFFQSTRFLGFFGIQPNFFLIFGLALAYFSKNTREGFLASVFVFLLMTFGSFFLARFYLIEIVVVIIFGMVSLFIRRFLTGTPEFDFSVLVLASSLLFYFVLVVWRIGFFPVGVILIEAGLNVLISFTLSRLLKKYNHYGNLRV